MPHSDHLPSPSRDTFAGLPLSPDNVPTVPLLRISLEKLLNGDAPEQERCWKACSPPPKTANGLQALHRLNALSGDQIRFVKAPRQDPCLAGVALGEHTDFGSVTVLLNRLGGLQVRLPSTIEPLAPSPSHPEATSAEKKLCDNGWTYVRPLPNHCIVNLGDALVKFSDGMLRSNVHRVVAPPGEQGKGTRYSLVYFCRPEDDVVLKCLVEREGADGSAEAVGTAAGGGEEGTAKEWILRRALGRRKMDGWERSGGTEGVSMLEKKEGMKGV